MLVLIASRDILNDFLASTIASRLHVLGNCGLRDLFRLRGGALALARAVLSLDVLKFAIAKCLSASVFTTFEALFAFSPFLPIDFDILTHFWKSTG